MTVFDRRLPGTDTCLGALTPEGIEFVLFPAGLPVRTCAYAIDKLIQWFMLIAVWTAASFHGGVWLMLILNFCVDWFYHVFFELFFRGQSPGKSGMGIRVIRSDGAPVDGASSFLRNLLRFADTFFFLCPIAFVSMAASPGFRRLGDWAGSTLVVYTPKAMSRSRKLSAASPVSELSASAPWLAALDAVIPARPLSAEEKQGALAFARRYPLLGEARANEIARFWAPHLRQPNVLPANAELFRAGDVSDAAYLLGIAKTLVGGTQTGTAGSGKV